MYEKTLKEISDKIGYTTKSIGKTSLVLLWEETITSTLCVKLALDSQVINNVKVFCIHFGSPLVLSNRQYASKIFQNCNIIGLETPELNKSKFTHTHSSNEQKLDLQNTLMQNILIHYADVNNGLIIGNIDKTIWADRAYYKYGQKLADLFPVLELLNSECEKALKEIYPEYSFTPEFNNEDNRYDIEWALKEHEKTGILTKEKTPDKDPMWFRYTIRQKAALSYLHQRWKLTKHKEHLIAWPT